MAFPLYSPVSFGPDINSQECECLGQEYKQPVETSDITRFQLPNNCPPTWGSELIANGSFTGSLASWSQGNGNGAVNEWTNVSNKARGVPTSKILNQIVTISQFNKYKLSLDLTLNAGCTLKVVLYRDPYLEGSTDYVEIHEFESTGTQTIEFTASEDFVRIGFILEGDCANSDIDNVSLKLASYSCLDLCIYDSDDVLIDAVPQSMLTYYGDFVLVQVDWAALGIGPGCYRICVCNDDDLVFADNLFTLGDNGTFEEDSTGITSDETSSRSTTRAYRGIYSFKAEWDSAIPSDILITSAFTLKRNTRYRLSARVYVNGGFNPGSSNAIISWRNPSDTGFSNATTNDSNTLDADLSADMQNWKEVYIDFTTNNSDNVGTFELRLSGSDWGVLFPISGVDVYIDNLILYEVDSYETCSQLLEISDEHTCTILLEWYNDEPYGPFYYDGTEDIKHSLRVRGKFRNPTFTGEKETFKDTAGTRKIIYAEKEQQKQLILEEVPAYIHEAIAAALDHDHFLVDGVEYVNKEPEYSPNWRKSSHLAPVIIELVKKSQDLRNSYC